VIVPDGVVRVAGRAAVSTRRWGGDWVGSRTISHTVTRTASRTIGIRISVSIGSFSCLRQGFGQGPVVVFSARGWAALV
jgi:hypothetical protein